MRDMAFVIWPASMDDLRDIAAVAIRSRFHNAFERSTYPRIYGGLRVDDTSISKEHFQELVAIRVAELSKAMGGEQVVHYVAERQGGDISQEREVAGFVAFEIKRGGITSSEWDVLLAKEYPEEIRRDYWRIMMPQYKHVLGKRPHMQLHTLYVLPEYQGQGVGHALARLVSNEADRQQLELFVERTPPGKLMYEKEKYGFVVKGASCLDMRKYGQPESEYRNYLMLRQPQHLQPVAGV